MIREVKKIDISDEVIEIKNVNYKRLQKMGVPPIQKGIDFAFRLAASKKRTGILLALASSAPKEEIMINLKQIGLENGFDLIISGSEDLKAYKDDEGTNKPKPYIYIESAKRLGIAPEFCLVFEDTKAGIDAAASAGMIAVAVPNPFTRTHDFSNASFIIESYEELTSFDVLNMCEK